MYPTTLNTGIRFEYVFEYKRIHIEYIPDTYPNTYTEYKEDTSSFATRVRDHRAAVVEAVVDDGVGRGRPLERAHVLFSCTYLCLHSLMIARIICEVHAGCLRSCQHDVGNYHAIGINCTTRKVTCNTLGVVPLQLDKSHKTAATHQAVKDQFHIYRMLAVWHVLRDVSRVP